MDSGDMSPGSSSRRAFLGTAAAAMATSGALGASVASAAGRRAAKRYVEKHRVDVHAHYLAPDYRSALATAGITGIGGIPIPAWTPDLAIRFMDSYGIAMQMLSVSDPGVSFVSDDAAPGLARTCNDYLAGVIAAHPQRFGGFAVVPLHDVGAAVAETRRALRTLKLDGIGLLSSAQGDYLGDPRFEPLLAELNASRAWVFVHPTAIASVHKPYPVPDFIAEYPFDTTRTILSLLFNASFQRYPKIRWHFAHGGGTVPMLNFRATVLARFAKQYGALLKLPAAASALTEKSVAQALRRSHFDTALIADAPGLTAVKELAGAKQIHFGSDWPFARLVYGGTGDPQPALSAVFTAAERHGIDRRNARAQFPRVARAVPKG